MHKVHKVQLVLLVRKVLKDKKVQLVHKVQLVRKVRKVPKDKKVK